MKKFIPSIAAFALLTSLSAHAVVLDVTVTMPTVNEPVDPNQALIVEQDGVQITGFGTNASSVVGDGIDDIYQWTFDYSSDPNAALLTSSNLIGAELTLNLTPRHGGVQNDFFRIQGLADINTAAIQSAVVNTATTIDLDLLTFYSASDIAGAFTGGTFGALGGRYQDDALVHSASLALTLAVPAPEPASFVLLGLGALVMSVGARRHARRA